VPADIGDDGHVRPGFGTRHPAMLEVLAACEPAEVEEVTIGNGAIRLRVAAHLGLANDPEVPDEIISSIRCLVRVDDHLIVCTNPGGTHAWPGGQREAGESWLDTACREVHEETGWIVAPESVAWVGWVHTEHLTPEPAGNRFPYPDYVNVLGLGRATERDPSHSGADTEGYELGHELVRIPDVLGRVTEKLVRPYLSLLS
jgi:8-oxo-dGTP pyrophosphatase MutT (NUDIX family)